VAKRRVGSERQLSEAPLNTHFQINLVNILPVAGSKKPATGVAGLKAKLMMLLII
jgi:hypothetical protein